MCGGAAEKVQVIEQTPLGLNPRSTRLRQTSHSLSFPVFKRERGAGNQRMASERGCEEEEEDLDQVLVFAVSGSWWALSEWKLWTS